MSTRNAMRVRAAQNKLKKGKGVAASTSAELSSVAPVPAPSRAPESASPADRHPIQRQEIQEEEKVFAEGGRGEEEEEEMGRDKGKGPAGPPMPSKSSPTNVPAGQSRWAKSLSRMARDAVEKAAVPDDRERFQKLERLSACWEEMRADLKGDRAQPAQPSELKRDRIVPRWNISAWSSILQSQPGEDSWELYEASILPRDQASMITNTPACLEEYAAHSLMQAGNFRRGLSIRCMNYRWNHTERNVRKLSAEIDKRDVKDLKFADEILVLAERIKELEGRLEEADKAKEVAVAEAREVAVTEARKEGFDAGREVGLIEGHKQGLEKGQAGRITVEEHHRILADSRMAVVRDFLKTDTFTTTVEINSADSYARGYQTCQGQIEKLGGFVESFDRDKLDITLDGDLQHPPDDPNLKDDEFMALREEMEAEADA
ncbi:UNVERIFIED_CONTAM: hypothetical protein Sindi_0108100 [Sesamum indicum]